MCMLFLYLNDNPQDSPFKMIVASNRDEYINRPTESAAFRGNTTKWVGGIDLVPGLEGGSWLGISRAGKFAALLNVFVKERPNTKPRGHWVPDFLESNLTCKEYMKIVAARMDGYNGFQLLCIDLNECPCRVHYINNKSENSHHSRTLSAGIHSCCNSSDFDKPWLKQSAGQEKFRQIVWNKQLVADQKKLVSNLMGLLNDRTRHFPDAQLSRQFEEVGKQGDTEEVHYSSAIHMCTTEDNIVTR